MSEKKKNKIDSIQGKNYNISKYGIKEKKENTSKDISTSAHKNMEFMSKKRNRKNKSKIEINSPFKNKKSEDDILVSPEKKNIQKKMEIKNIQSSQKKEKDREKDREKENVTPSKKLLIKNLNKKTLPKKNYSYSKTMRINFIDEKEEEMKNVLKKDNKDFVSNLNINMSKNYIKLMSPKKELKENIFEEKIIYQSNKLDSPKLNENKESFNKETNIYHKIIVKNIDTCKVNEIKEFFIDCGNIFKIDIKKNTKDSTKVAIIHFKKKEECDQAIKKNGELLKANKIKIKYCKDWKNEKGEKEIKGSKIKNIEKEENNENNKKEGKIESKIEKKDDKEEKDRNSNSGDKNKESPKFLDESAFNAKLLKFRDELKKEINENINKIIKENINITIKESNIKIGLLNLINLQSEKYLNIKIESLNNKIKKILNTYQILYIKKVTNFIIEKIIQTYSICLAKTKKKFELNNKKKNLG